MNVLEKAQLRGSGFTGDEIKAYEQAWNEIPEPIEIVMKRDGTIYFDGQMSNMRVDFGDIATLADGTPVVIKEPVPGGDYRWHAAYNPANLEAYRDERFGVVAREIKKKRWADWQDVQNPAALVLQTPPPTTKECINQWLTDLIEYRGLLTGVRKFSRDQFKCICFNPSCPHYGARR